jgi:hypothetical protein
MSYTPQPISNITMPHPRLKSALHFSGQLGEPVEEFLQKYGEIADGAGLNEQQKVELVIRYIAPPQRYMWKSLDAFANRD